MPVILLASDWGAWLDPATPDAAALQGMLRPAPDDLLIRYPVTKRVNSARNEGPDLVVPLGPLGPEPGQRQLPLD
jgi:putative SOS response-associated peptidase YedK